MIALYQISKKYIGRERYYFYTYDLNMIQTGLTLQQFQDMHNDIDVIMEVK